MIAMYLYVAQYIQSVTHKYLIQGHTQNEGDSIHSIIEKSLTRAAEPRNPDQFMFQTNMCPLSETLKRRENHNMFEKLIVQTSRTLRQNDIALTMTEDVSGNDFKLSEIKVVRFEKGSKICFFLNDYNQLKWNELNFTSKKTCAGKSIETNNIVLKSTYT